MQTSWLNTELSEQVAQMFEAAQKVAQGEFLLEEMLKNDANWVESMAQSSLEFYGQKSGVLAQRLAEILQLDFENQNEQELMGEVFSIFVADVYAVLADSLKLGMPVETLIQTPLVQTLLRTWTERLNSVQVN